VLLGINLAGGAAADGVMVGEAVLGQVEAPAHDDLSARLVLDNIAQEW
jgi:hypothetical protein